MTISMTIGQIGQLVGFVAAAVVAASFQCRRERTIALFLTVSSALFVVHYALLGQLSGAVMQVPVLLRNLLVLSRRPWVLRRTTMVVLLVLIGGLSLLSWEGVFSLFPLIALVGSTLALWSDRAAVIRRTQLLVASPAWMIYNISVRSWAGILCETMDIASVVAYYIRTGVQRKGVREHGTGQECSGGADGDRSDR